MSRAPLTGRCGNKGCKRARMPGSDRCFPCGRQRQRTPPEVTARQIAALTGDRSDFDDAAQLGEQERHAR